MQSSHCLPPNLPNHLGRSRLHRAKFTQLPWATNRTPLPTCLFFLGLISHLPLPPPSPPSPCPLSTGRRRQAVDRAVSLALGVLLLVPLHFCRRPTFWEGGIVSGEGRFPRLCDYRAWSCDVDCNLPRAPRLPSQCLLMIHSPFWPLSSPSRQRKVCGERSSSPKIRVVALPPAPTNSRSMTFSLPLAPLPIPRQFPPQEPTREKFHPRSPRNRSLPHKMPRRFPRPNHPRRAIMTPSTSPMMSPENPSHENPRSRLRPASTACAKASESAFQTAPPT